MGSRSKRHGLATIKHLRPKSNPAHRVRNDRLVEAKQPLLAEIRRALAETPEVA